MARDLACLCVDTLARRSVVKRATAFWQVLAQSLTDGRKDSNSLPVLHAWRLLGSFALAVWAVGNGPEDVVVPMLLATLATIAWPGKNVLALQRGRPVGQASTKQGQRPQKPAHFVKSLRRHWQRRRLYVEWSSSRTEKELLAIWRSLVPRTPRQAIARAACILDDKCSVHRYHAVPPAGFLLPPEVVECSHLPDPGLQLHTARLLRDRWNSEAMPLAAIPEHESRHKAGWISFATQVAGRVWF
eukprot:gb/GFBE01037836.1/.p1 GENE.gb/GFBE01037836.1/~~gb/GFBE01037836.1/.p1  ORF type:complete len:244 (+),score=9.52 gb/GFBE01037836.1/:1-732(+)